MIQFDLAISIFFIIFKTKMILKKSDWAASENVWSNCQEIYSCMKICFSKEIEFFSIIDWARKNKQYILYNCKLNMQDIYDICKELNKDFFKYFKIICK